MTGSCTSRADLRPDGCRPPRCLDAEAVVLPLVPHRASAKSPAAPRSCQAPCFGAMKQTCCPDRLAPPRASALSAAAAPHPCTAIHGLILPCSACKVRCPQQRHGTPALRAVHSPKVLSPRYAFHRWK